MRFFMDISYHGGEYHGWQTQQNAETVQQTIEKALKKITNEPIPITGSGRTDTGVHASHQVAHFDYSGKTPQDKLAYQLNAVLPRSIAIAQIREVSDQAHARFDAMSRRYDYFIHHTKNPFKEGLSYQFAQKLHIDPIIETCEIIKGNTDFESFSRVKTEVNNFNCTIHSCQWSAVDEGYQFTIIANRFLRGMVRALVGTLIDVGLGKLSVAEFDLIVRQKDRRAAGAAAPPHGLYLSKVNYPDHIFIE